MCLFLLHFFKMPMPIIILNYIKLQWQIITNTNKHCHTTGCEPVLDGDDFVVAGTISGGMVSLVKQAAAKQPSQAIVEFRKDAV